MSISIPAGHTIYDFYHSVMWLKNGILYIRYKPDIVINLRVAKDIVQDRMKISAGIFRPLFIDVTELLCIDAEGRNYLAKAGCGLTSAGAIYSKNPLLAFVGNAFILLDRPMVPTKVFSNEAVALRWLELFKFPN